MTKLSRLLQQEINNATCQTGKHHWHWFKSIYQCLYWITQSRPRTSEMTIKPNRQPVTIKNKHCDLTGIYCRTGALCCKAFLLFFFHLILRKSAVLLTSLQSLHMALVYRERFGWGVYLTFIHTYIQPRWQHRHRAETKSQSTRESKVSKRRTRKQERNASDKKENIYQNCLDTEMDWVKKMKNYTTDSKNLHDSVAAGRTNIKEKCAFFCFDLQLAETHF